MTRRAVLAILLLSVTVPSVPLVIRNVRLAARLLPLSWEQRHEALMPAWYANVEALRRRIPAREPLAVIGLAHENLDDAAFIRYYLFPHRVEIYRDRWAYLTAVQRPKLIIGVDARTTTYAEVRNRDIRRSRVVRPLILPSETRTRFFIPIVTSTDGLPPVEYTVEGALAADGVAHVRLTLWPQGTIAGMTICGTRAFYDLVYQSFGVMQFAGWVSVDSDRPLRAAFWLVNRTARAASPIRLVDGPLRAPVPFPALPKPTLLWLVNPSGSYVVAHAGSHPALVPPHGLIGINPTGTVRGPVYAFLSRKMPDGSTRFTWPEDVR